jgi:hypothetical protein
VWPPTLSSRNGYFLESSGPVAPGSQRVPYTAASTIPFTQGPAAFPDWTAAHLPADGFVIYAALASPGTRPPLRKPDFPPSRLPLHHLLDFQVRHRWKRQVALNVPEYFDRGMVGGQLLDVRVWFGTQSPSEATLDRAQRELGTLLAPPPPVGRCPNRPAPGLVLSRTSGRVGSSFRVAGVNIPGPNKIGQIVGPGMLGFWWNLDPSKYWTVGGNALAHAAPGPVVLLGVQGRSSRCGYEIVLKVPNVSPGTYTITPVVETREGAGGTSLQPLTFAVSSGMD